MPLSDIQDILRDLNARRGADRALIDTIAADEAILRGSAEAMLGSSLNMNHAHMVGSVDMAAIRTRLETSTARLLNTLSAQYTAVCNDMINVLGNAGAGGVYGKAIKNRNANATALREITRDLPMIRLDLMNEFGQLSLDFRQGLAEVRVLESIRGTSAEAAQLAAIIVDLEANLIAGGAPAPGDMNDKLVNIFEAPVLQEAESRLDEYVNNHQPIDATTTYDRLYEYFQNILLYLLQSLESIIEVYDGTTTTGRTPPEDATLRTMRDMEARLCKVFKECVLRVFGGNADVAANIDGAGDTFSEVTTALLAKSIPLGLDDGAAPVIIKIPPELKRLKEFIRKHSPTNSSGKVDAYLGTTAFIEQASNRVSTSASEAGSLLTTLTRIQDGVYAGDPVADDFANKIVFGPNLPSIGYSGGDIKGDIVSKVSTKRAGK